VYTAPTERELADWGEILNLFREGKTDSCIRLLARYGYTLTRVRDGLSGNTIDVFSETAPVRLGWGTLLYNRDGVKRLVIHVNHPLDDGNVAVVGAELFRRSGAGWLLISGSSKHAAGKSTAADPASAEVSVFQKWHELTSGPDQISVSLHGYNPDYYGFPISSSDVVISNGRTTDEQWGISNLSMCLRDSLRASGFQAALAMMDSGFARLSAGRNPQGVRSNDLQGFGRWLNVELASGVRYNSDRYLKFIDIAGRALDLGRKTAAGETADAFDLVSPRVIKINRSNRLLFPPPQPEKYRIISFTPGETKNDTLDLLFGKWFEGASNGKTIARILEVDSTGALAERIRRTNAAVRAGQSKMTTLISTTPGKYPSGMLTAEHETPDSLRDGEEDMTTREPLQVHRIPLRPVLASTVTPDIPPATMPFHWGRILPEGFSPQILTFRAGQPGMPELEVPGLSRFLIPLLKNSYRPETPHFIGVDMTDILVNEIARLVNEYRIEGQEIGLLAEQGENGDYYLRLFPENTIAEISSNLP
ncbi:MAG TPA: hypothetical protein VJO14_08065, partial [Bacteroidota bacterium]|nr:hypothetical protein [Bacteroidota bacterium]